jgi:preprotein translocase subunit SecE
MHEVRFMSEQQHITADHEEDEQNEAESSARSVSTRSEGAKRKKDRRMTVGTHWLFQLGLYKRNQGRIIRQVTFAALLLTVALGAWRLSELAHRSAFKFAVPLAIVVGGGWIVYRLVNLPRFADFLIAVEAEMTKVSWPTRSELIRSSVVVIITIIGFAVLLWFYDTFWGFLLRHLGV